MVQLKLDDIYIERCDKESDEIISKESNSFLDKQISFLKEKEHMNEYVFFDFEALSQIGIDGLALEVDDLFHTYSVMLGLPAQKKKENDIKAFLHEKIRSEKRAFAAMFNQTDGVWDVNFSINYVEGYNENLTFREALTLIYNVINELISSLKEG